MATGRNQFADRTLHELAELGAGCMVGSLQDQAVRAEFLRRQTQAQIEAAHATKRSALWVLFAAVVALLNFLVSIYFQLTS